MKLHLENIEISKLWVSVPEDQYVTVTMTLSGEDDGFNIQVLLTGKFDRDISRPDFTYSGQILFAPKNLDHIYTSPASFDVAKKDLGIKTYDDTQKSEFAEDFDTIRSMMEQIRESLLKERISSIF